MTKDRKQEIFNKEWEHFIVNKRGPGMKGSGCSYEGGCAIGILLSNETACELDKVDAGTIGNVIPAGQSGIDFELALKVEQELGLSNESPDTGAISFLQALQQEHDEASYNMRTFTAVFEKRLREIAQSYFLTIPGE